MYVKILDILQKGDQKDVWLVEFFYTLRRSTDLLDKRNPEDSQNLLGKWIGDAPEKDAWYSVEIEIEDELVWEESVHPTEPGEAWIKASRNGTYLLQGELDVFDDGVGTLLVGGSLVGCRMVGISKPIQNFVRIEATTISLWDINRGARSL